MSALEIDVGKKWQGVRLDRFLTDKVPSMSRTQAKRLISENKVRVNGQKRAKGSLVYEGDVIQLLELPIGNDFYASSDTELTLEVVFEDEWLVVINKQAGIPSHPLKPNERGNIASALVARYPEMATIGYRGREPGIVHRLDTDTSGLLIASRTADAFERLTKAIKAGKIDKCYQALCKGRVLAPQKINSWLVPDKVNRRRVNVYDHSSKGSRPAKTEIINSITIGYFSLITVRVCSALRHQIRAHLSWIGHPLVGDKIYGGDRIEGLKRHFLHASEIRFDHPITSRSMHIYSPLPDELQDVLEEFGRNT